MLILTRRNGETIRVGDDIEITVLAINGKRVRIGTDCTTRNLSASRGGVSEDIGGNCLN